MVHDFSTLDIQRALDIPPERFRAWNKEGYLIHPTFPAAGQGTRASYSLDRVYCIALFKSLLTRGLHRKTASRLVSLFWSHSFDLEKFPECETTKVTLAVFGYSTDNPDEEPFISLIEGPISKGYYLNENGVSGAANSTLGRPKDFNGWDHLHVVNIKRLVEKVNAALGI